MFHGVKTRAMTPTGSVGARESARTACLVCAPASADSDGSTGVPESRGSIAAVRSTGWLHGRPA
jgi:hypothetical protein